MGATYPLYIGGQVRGELTASKQGLYTVIDARCEGEYEGICRAYAVCGGERLYLGIMVPEAGALTCRKKFSRNELAGIPKLEYCVVETEDEISFNEREWHMERADEAWFSDPILATSLSSEGGVLTKKEGEIRLLAFPYLPDREFHLTPLFCFASFQEIGGGTYAVFAADENGAPMFI